MLVLPRAAWPSMAMLTEGYRLESLATIGAVRASLLQNMKRSIGSVFCVYDDGALNNCPAANVGANKGSNQHRPRNSAAFERPGQNPASRTFCIDCIMLLFCSTGQMTRRHSKAAATIGQHEAPDRQVKPAISRFVLLLNFCSTHHPIPASCKSLILQPPPTVHGVVFAHLLFGSRRPRFSIVTAPG